MRQRAGLVPIVEPEILTDGDHDIHACAAVTERVLARVFAALHEHRVMMEGMILKPNMVTAGKSAPAQAPVDDVARATLAARETPRA